MVEDVEDVEAVPVITISDDGDDGDDEDDEDECEVVGDWPGSRLPRWRKVDVVDLTGDAPPSPKSTSPRTPTSVSSITKEAAKKSGKPPKRPNPILRDSNTYHRRSTPDRPTKRIRTSPTSPAPPAPLQHPARANPTLTTDAKQLNNTTSSFKPSPNTNAPLASRPKPRYKLGGFARTQPGAKPLPRCDDGATLAERNHAARRYVADMTAMLEIGSLARTAGARMKRPTVRLEAGKGGCEPSAMWNKRLESPGPGGLKKGSEGSRKGKGGGRKLMTVHGWTPVMVSIS